MSDDLPQLFDGDHVEDRDDPSATMIVVGLTDDRADQYELGEVTVADYNRNYPADDDVVEVVYPQRTDKILSTDEGARYAFPRERLRRVEPVHDLDDDVDVQEERDEQ